MHLPKHQPLTTLTGLETRFYVHVSLSCSLQIQTFRSNRSKQKKKEKTNESPRITKKAKKKVQQHQERMNVRKRTMCNVDCMVRISHIRTCTPFYLWVFSSGSTNQRALFVCIVCIMHGLKHTAKDLVCPFYDYNVCECVSAILSWTIITVLSRWNEESWACNKKIIEMRTQKRMMNSRIFFHSVFFFFVRKLIALLLSTSILYNA